jgi:Flp pilus assembly protein TadD
MQMGRYAEAIAMLERGCSLAGDMPNLMGALGQAYALAGDQPRARAILAALHERAQTEYVPNTSIAIVHLGLGEKETALDYLERAVAQRDLPVSNFRSHPLYDCLRSEPRFQALLRQVGFAAVSGSSG